MKHILAAALLVIGGATQAAHITDKLAVGLLDTPDAQTPRRVLVSGTPVEVLEQAGAMCRVGLGDDDGGWLECRYVTREKPARAMLLEAQARAGEMRRRIESLERQVQSPRESAPPPAAHSTRAENRADPVPDTDSQLLFAALVGGFVLGSVATFFFVRE